MKTEPDTMRFRLCSLLKYLGGRGKLRFLRTGMFFQNIPVLRSAYFPKKLFSFFSKTLDLQPLCGLRKGAEGNPSVCCGDNSP